MVRFCRFAILLSLSILCAGSALAQVAGQNVNMVSGTQWPAGDPFLQRQNEPSIAVSSRNPEHLMGGANDYRTVDIPNPQAPTILGDAWLGVYTTLDGGETWKSTLLPGYPQDTSAIGKASPLHGNYTVATDPTVRAGTHGLFYYSGLVFNRAANSPSAVFVAVFQDQNNKGNGDGPLLVTDSTGTHGNPFQYINATLVHTANTRQFLDKPWIAVDVPRPGKTAYCKINGQSFQSGYVYVFYTVFTNAGLSTQHSSIMEVMSTNCGATWTPPQKLNDDTRQNQGTVAAIDPNTGAVFATWRATAYKGMPDSIQYAWSPDGWIWANGITDGLVYQFPTQTATAGAFDQTQEGNNFRTIDIPSAAIDSSSRIWVAFSLREPGPNGTAASRIVLTTQSFPMALWSKPYVADASSWSGGVASTYGHQFMPSLNFAYGKLSLAWFDSRRDNLESVLTCPSGTSCTSLAQLQAKDQPIPGSTIANPATIFTPNLADPSSGIRHTLDVFGGVMTPSAGQTVKGFQISQYPYWVDPANNNQIEQGFFNPPNLPMFAQGTTPFIGDYIDIAAQTIIPSGNSWKFNTQGTDTSTGATLAPDFHVAWTDNRDVVPPPVVNGNQDWTQYAPPNSGYSQTSVYSGTGAACPTCSTTQTACTIVTPDGGGSSSYSGDRNQNVYTSRISNGLIVRFRENSKPLSTSIQRSFSLLIKNTVPPLSTTPLGSPSYYRILLGVTSTSQSPTCAITGGTAALPGTSNCYLDVAVNPNTVLTQPVTVMSTSATASVNVLVAQIQAIPTGSTAPTFMGLEALAIINGDPSNPSVANPDFTVADNSNPDVTTPYGNLPIASGEEYDPTVDGPANPANGIFTPKIGVPAVFTPLVGTAANSAPAVETPSVFTPKIGNEIASVQIVNPTIVDTIFTPKINAPQIFTPKIVSPEIFTPKITDLSDSGSNSITDYSWVVSNKGNTTASYDTQEFPKAAGISCCPASCSANPSSCTVTSSNPAGPNCSVCQLIQQKVYESPVANRDSSTGNATCDLNVQQAYTTVANIIDPAFSTGVGGSSPANPTYSTLALGPGEGNRVTLRTVAPPVSQTVASFKTVATAFVPDKGQSAPASSLTVTTSALPVAVVGQSYPGAQLTSIGGLGTTAWSVPANPSNPVAATLPIPPEPLPVTPLTLNQSGQVSTGVVTASPGSYVVSMQVQDAATTPSLDVQQVTVDVNQFTISDVDPEIVNQVGSTGYMKAGDTATVAVTISSQGPAIATSVVPTLAVNTVAGGTPTGPAPVVNCTGPNPASASIQPSSAQVYNFTCTAMSGNGYVSFTANATGQYVNSAASVTAIATPVSEPSVTPGGTPPNIIVDTVTPVLTFNNASPKANAYGWNNTAVTFTYTTGDNLSGPYTSTPNPLVLSAQGKNLSGVVTITDYANNSTTFTAPTSTMPAVNIDLTPPVITTTSTYTPGTWTNQNVTVAFTCTDNLSGPLVSGAVTNPIITGLPATGASLSYSQPNSLTSIATVTLTAETAGTTLSSACQDFAGNNAGAVQFGPILIDKTPPVMTVSATTPSGSYAAGSWTNQNVSVTYSCSDNASLVANSGVAPGYPTGSQAFTAETAGSNTSGTCVDRAGNVSSNSPLAFGPVKIDKTPPVLTLVATTPAGVYTAGTWTNQNVTVSYACVDNASAVANSGVAAFAPTQQIFSTETSSGMSSSSCTDAAGNAAVASFSPIQIDKTPPVLTVVATTADSNPYTAGVWTNQSVTVTYTCQDNASPLNVNSGLAAGSPSGTQTFSSETPLAGVNASGSCTDQAGNVATNAPLAFGPVKIDLTPPTVTGTATAGGNPYTAGTWTNQPVVVTFVCSDSLSGPNNSTITGNMTDPTQQVTSANGSCQDNAGNLGTGTFGPIQIDTVGPAVMVAAPSPNQQFILNSLITPSFTCGQSANEIDAVNCIETPSGSPYTATPVGPGTFSVSGTDQAGNTASSGNIPYLVVYNFTGFETPLQTATAPTATTQNDSGSFVAGTTIAVQWQLQDATNAYISNLSTLKTVQAFSNSTCAGGPSGTAIPLYDSSNPSLTAGFAYNSTTNTFGFNWNTTGLAVGCYNLVVTLDDTTQHTTIVHLATDAFTGFDAPLANASAPAAPSNSGSFDVGSTLPVMWQLLTPSGPPDAGQNVTVNNVTVYGNPACTGAPQPGASSTVLYDLASNVGSFSFEPSTAVYTVNWASGSAPAGCYDIVATMSDQSVYTTMVTLAPTGGTTTLLQYNFDNLPQGPASQTAPASFAAPNVTGGSFGFANNPNGMFDNGCAMIDCIDPAEVTTGEFYNFSFTNSTPISQATISFSEFNNDCYGASPGCTGQSFLVQYDTSPAFDSPTTVTSFTPPTAASQQYTFPIGTLPANTYYFRITATGTSGVNTAQYVLDNVTIAGTH